MPLFFMLSGITYELSVKRNSDIRQLKNMAKKRVVNLIVPVIFMVGMNLIIYGRDQTIFHYYQNGWFLVFLAIFILINSFMDYIFIKFRNIEKLTFILSLLAWAGIGIVQLFLTAQDRLILAKFACEISKFFGYFICFLSARQIIRQQEKWMRFDIKFYAVLLFGAAVMAAGIILQVDPNGALAKIICGFPVSIVLLILFNRFKKSCSKTGRTISKYSLEIYLIHWNIIHGIFLPMFSFCIKNLWNSLIFVIALLFIDIAVPVLIGYCEDYIKPLKFIFHPMKKEGLFK